MAPATGPPPRMTTTCTWAPPRCRPPAPPPASSPTSTAPRAARSRRLPSPTSSVGSFGPCPSTSSRTRRAARRAAGRPCPRRPPSRRPLFPPHHLPLCRSIRHRRCIRHRRFLRLPTRLPTRRPVQCLRLPPASPSCATTSPNAPRCTRLPSRPCSRARGLSWQTATMASTRPWAWMAASAHVSAPAGCCGCMQAMHAMHACMGGGCSSC
jgi:hypothetical protein